VVYPVACVVLRQEFREMLFFMGIFEDETERGNGREFIPVSAFTSPLKIFLHLQKGIVLSERLKQ